MKPNDRDDSIIRDTIKRAKAENIKEKIQDLSVSQAAPPSGDQIKHRLRTLRKQVGDPKEARKRLERVLKGDDLTDINYLAQGFLRARAVCRIVICCDGAEEGYGTGFLIAPGVLITNYHVLQSVAHVRESYTQFNYERDFRGNILPTRFALHASAEPILCEELDMAIAAVERISTDGKQLDEYGWLKLSGQPGKAFIGEYLTAIQHPRGEPKQVCVRENKLLKYSKTDPFVWYQTDTDAGSSGSPVFNNAWEVVALHHSSVPRTNDKGEWLTKRGQLWKKGEMSDDLIDWIANEGVRVSRIVEYLQKQSNNRLADAVLNTAEAPAEEWFRNLGAGSSRSMDSGSAASVGNVQVQTDSEGVTRILVPIEISVKVGAGGYEKAPAVSRVGTPPPMIADLSQTPPPPPLPAFEKIDVDQTNYPLRNGYDPGFLGEGLSVPLPV